MNCFPDVCLACDRQITDGFYCSQACRLADLERAGSAPQSPNNISHPSTNAWNSAHLSGDFQGPSPLNNYNYRYRFERPSTSPSRTFAHPMSSSQTSYQQSSHTPTPFHVLSPSSSRSSLASRMSHSQSSSSDGLSEEAKNELRAYFDSFDRTREQRRRSYPTLHLQTSPAQHQQAT